MNRAVALECRGAQDLRHSEARRKRRYDFGHPGLQPSASVTVNLRYHTAGSGNASSFSLSA